MKQATRRNLALGGALAAALGVTAYNVQPVAAWQSPSVEVRAAGCEALEVTVGNPEGTIQHFVSSGGLFPNGSSIPAHGTVSTTIHGTGTVHITVTLDSPDHTTASADGTFTACPRDTTTTTTPSSSTTDPTVPPPSSSSTLPPPLVQCTGDAAPHERTAADDDVAGCHPVMVANPKFTG